MNGVRAAGNRGTATNADVTRINRTAILDALRTAGPLGRAELVAATGLASATVHRLCARMVEEGLLGVERDTGGVGRPTHRYRHLGEARTVVAVDVTSAIARGALIDLDGETRHTETRQLQDADGLLTASSRLEGVGVLAERLIRVAAGIGSPAQGIGLSVPGVVDADGAVSDSVELGWNGVAVRDALQTRTGLPVVVENDANAVTIGEWTHGAGQGTGDLAALVFGIGVGAGIVSGDRLVRGAGAAAGEIGYLITDPQAFSQPRPTGGDLETRVLALGGAGGTEASTMSVLDDESASVGADAERLLDHIAMSVAALSVILDCRVVILAGRLPRRTDLLVGGVTRRLEGRIPRPPAVVVGALGEDAALVGIGQLIIDHVKGAVYLA
ncbi:ROK family transcriptional regulator [Microbacterium sp. KSW4-11]|uniref:ROK family transcriptional regulator n=1 Tax=Microbacterium gawkjiense TaxID=3067309 RepID=A0ABU3G9B0_9MICO|nr:ROK family transcriptional regulator [Microbacterium sp. KSW4-11]MDT3316408.1 ROK family transcriptional regulator [Microbacterium sp. KSW4-11]